MATSRQFHKRFTHSFFVQNFGAKNHKAECNKSVICFRTKNACVKFDEIDTRGQFQQHVYSQLLPKQIPQVQKDTDDLNVFLRYWDL